MQMKRLQRRHPIFPAVVFLMLCAFLCAVPVGEAVQAAPVTSEWAEGIVDLANSRGITVAADNYTVAITRRQMCELIYNAQLSGDGLGEEQGSMGDIPFDDIRAEDYKIAACYRAGIISGMSETKFAPGNLLTREQAANIVLRAVAYAEQKYGKTYIKESGENPNYADDGEIADWARSLVYKAYYTGLMQGDGTNFHPKNNISIQESVVMVNNAYNLYVGIEANTNTGGNGIGSMALFESLSQAQAEAQAEAEAAAMKQAEEKAKAEANTKLNGKYAKDELDAILKISTTYKSLKEQTVSDVYAAQPNAQPPFAAGKLNQSVIDLGIAHVNLARYIAGVPDNVTADSANAEAVQAAAVLMDYTKTLNHTPTKPAGMDESFYKLAYKGASTSNLSAGSGITGSVWSYLADSSTSNRNRVGHRRWVLNPRMGKTTFGASSSWSAMYAFDNSNPKAATAGVAWPSRVFPVDMMSKAYPWSVTVSPADLSSAGSISVKLTRERGNKTWEINAKTSGKDGAYFNVDKGNYGNSNAIIFIPPYETETDFYQKDDIFHVEITGLKKPITYMTKFFNLTEGLKAGEATVADCESSLKAVAGVDTKDTAQALAETAADTPGAAVGTESPAGTPYVKFEKRSYSINVGESFVPSYTFYMTGGDVQFSFASSSSAVASYNSGRLAALKAGTTNITVTMRFEGKSYSDTIAVTVKDTAADDQADAGSISFDQKKLSLKVGETATPKYTHKGTSPSYDYKSSDTSVATYVRGTVTALKAGTTTLTVTMSIGTKKYTDTMTVTVTEDVPTGSISFDEKTLNLEVGDTATPKYTHTGASPTFTYRSSSQVASYTNGTVTALQAGNCTITVTMVTGGRTYTDTMTVIVTKKPEKDSDYIAFEDTSLTIEVGESVTPRIWTSGVTQAWQMSYTSSDNSIAGYKNKTLTGVSAGKCSITVTWKGSNFSHSAQLDVTVVDKPTTGDISFDEAALTLEVGETADPSVSNTISGATPTLSYSSSDESVATYKNGKVKAIGAGSCTITVTAQAGEKTWSDKMSITVTEAAPTGSISFDGSSLRLTVGDSEAPSHKFATSGSSPTFTYDSSDTSVATYTNGMVDAVGPGTCTITITMNVGAESWSATMKVTVSEA